MSEAASQKNWGKLIISKYWLYVPAILGILIMIPRLSSAEFGFLDDAIVLIKSQRLLNGEWNQLLELGSGRFRPLYWLYPALIYSLAKMRPEWFFIGNLLLLVSTTIGLTIFANRLTKSKLIAFFSGLFFVLSGPVIESYYTLSKGEPLQIAWILFSLLALCGINRSKTRKSKNLTFGLLILFGFLAIISKETSLVMVPISAIWFLGSIIQKRITKTETDWKRIGLYLASMTTAAGLYFILRMILLPANAPADGYASNYIMDPTRLITAMKQWERWIRRDFFFLLPLFVIPMLDLLRTRQIDHANVLFQVLTWMIGWAFVFLPWVFQVEYYLLAFAVGSSLLGGILLEHTVRNAKHSGKIIRLLAVVCIVAAAFFFIVTLPNNYTNGRLQLTVDENNAAMLSFVVNELPANSTFYINIQEPNQYVDDIKLWVSEIMGRSDLHVEHYQYQMIFPSNDPNPDYYVASPYLDNQYYRSVRLGVGETSSKTWDESMLSFVGESADIIYETYGVFRLSIIDFRFGCLFVDEPAYCDIPTVPIDDRVLTYGWRVYRIPMSQ
jgi:hypothetical protein